MAGAVPAGSRGLGLLEKGSIRVQGLGLRDAEFKVSGSV